MVGKWVGGKDYLSCANWVFFIQFCSLFFGYREDAPILVCGGMIPFLFIGR